MFPGNPHGHSGHVRFLTCVEMSPELRTTTMPFGKNHGRFGGNKGNAATGAAAGAKENAGGGTMGEKERLISK